MHLSTYAMVVFKKYLFNIILALVGFCGSQVWGGSIPKGQGSLERVLKCPKAFPYELSYKHHTCYRSSTWEYQKHPHFNFLELNGKTQAKFLVVD